MMPLAHPDPARPRRRAAAFAATLAALLSIGTALPAQAYSPGSIDLAFTRVASGLSRPVVVTNAGDGTNRLFIVEQDGRIKVRQPSGTISTYLDINTRVYSGGNEQGLLGLAFHPNFESNGRFYVYYTRSGGDIVIAEYRQRGSSPNTASTTERLLFTIEHSAHNNHNGGQLAFGKDGMLYAAVGDGGSGGDPNGNGQNLNTLLGKILRFSPVGDGPGDYYVPASNPFVGKTGLDLIWQYGLRNPWRFSFDPATGDLWIGDVGQESWEEVDWAMASTTGRSPGNGYNWGWSCFEGFHQYTQYRTCNPSNDRFPVAEMSSQTGSANCSVTGGYVYRGTAYPDMRGTYIFGDYCSGRVWALHADASTTATQNEFLLRDTGYNISAFGEDENGYLYLASLGTGEVFRLRDTTP
jgi:glucose/arabinose dehydrogenase